MRSAASCGCGAVEVLCIFNEAFDGVGVNYRTNTTSLASSARRAAAHASREGHDRPQT